jgi:hypothetical protein
MPKHSYFFFGKMDLNFCKYRLKLGKKYPLNMGNLLSAARRASDIGMTISPPPHPPTNNL